MEETETVLTLADFGALLRERRIHKGLTEENVAAELKITSRLVKAIEEGDMESMPHAVYARGFIRAYAKLLAVDDSVTHAACALLKDPEEELREQEIRVVPAAARREESHVPWLAILLCALFLAGGAWYFRDSIPGLSSNTVSREKTASPAVSSPAVPEADTVVTTPAFLWSRLRTPRFLRHRRNRLFWVERLFPLKPRRPRSKRLFPPPVTVCC